MRESRKCVDKEKKQTTSSNLLCHKVNIILKSNFYTILQIVIGSNVYGLRSWSPE